MKLILFGATGHTGKFVLDEALKAGHHITALVRDVTKLQQQHKRLQVVIGDALKEEDVMKVVKGKDAVISTISEGPDIVHKTQSEAVSNMIKAMETTGIERIICMGAIGILQFNATELIRDQSSYPALYRPLSFEHSAVNKLLQTTNLKWTQVCPPTILAVPADDNFVVQADYPPTKNMEVNAGNIGMFIMQELEKNEFLSKRVGITNA